MVDLPTLHSRMSCLNGRLDEVEQSIINLMKLKNPRAFEVVHCLIGERENIICELKETHKELYG